VEQLFRHCVFGACQQRKGGAIVDEYRKKATEAGERLKGASSPSKPKKSESSGAPSTIWQKTEDWLDGKRPTEDTAQPQNAARLRFRDSV
jgi:hypothetical protein